MQHLPIAIRQFDYVFVYDNSTFNAKPQLVIEARYAGIRFIRAAPPRWVPSVVHAVAFPPAGGPPLQFLEKVTHTLYWSPPALQRGKQLTHKIIVAVVAALRTLERNPRVNDLNVGSVYVSAYGSEYRMPYSVEPSGNRVTVQLIEQIQPF